MIEQGKYFVTGKTDPIHKMLYEMISKEDIYMHYRLSGTLTDVCNDMYFLTHENGRGLSRIWMCWGKRPGAVSNWGAVYTEEDCRGRGLCRKTLEYCFSVLDSMENPPPALFCTAGEGLTPLYGEFGFVPALHGRTFGPLYRPMKGSPATFQEFCRQYYTPAKSLRAIPAHFGWRNEIDCLLRFALYDMDKAFGIGEERDLYLILMKEPERAKVILTEEDRCVGWMLDGRVQLHPLYEGMEIAE